MSNLSLLVPVLFVALIFLSKWINVLNGGGSGVRLRKPQTETTQKKFQLALAHGESGQAKRANEPALPH